MNKIYHVKTQADYDALMVELEKEGCRWLSGALPKKHNHWDRYEEETCVEVYPSKNLNYSYKSHYEAEEYDIQEYTATNNVNSPNHYKQGKQEVIEIIEESATSYPVSVSYHIGNTIKYIMRAPFKGRMKEDLEKDNWYLERAIKRL